MNNKPGSTRLLAPRRRPLRVFAFDPSHGRLLGNEMQVDVRYRGLAPGPVDRSGAHDQIAVVDYDISRKKYYRPVDLDDPFILISNGIAPSEADPRFHQQMVYAVASDTIEQFENALGRRIHWRRAERPLDSPPGWLPDDILTLTLFPHAMQQANAYYSPEAHGILFGYFKAGLENAGRNIPGQTVFTCLSHDIIVHELTHAIVDGMRSHFTEQTNPDVAAFHEAFADLAALFRHFTHREVLLDAIQRTGGRLYTSAMNGDMLADLAAQSWLTVGEAERNPLVELASQYGEATGKNQGLRSAIGKPKTMAELRGTTESHERGSIMVAAVFDAFFTVYLQRAAKHFQIYRSGGGNESANLPSPLAEACCEEAVATAEYFFRTCVRALDYLPPVDVTFGDFLRAVMTAESDYDPEDPEGIRSAWMQAFRHRGILPDDALSFSEAALCWPPCPHDIKVESLPFGGPLGPSYEERKQIQEALKKFMDKAENKKILDLDADMGYAIPSFHTSYRMNRSGNVRWDMVVEVVQTATGESGTYPRRGGTTMIISSGSTGGGGNKDIVFLRYAISKPLGGDKGLIRAERQQSFLAEQGIKPGGSASDLRINFALLHSED
ncbi:MAG TPA: hypothetical protein VFI43_02915 [Nitrosospira sp.]|nr:hypothetical protein [Nitrosospira sp.]